MKSKKANLFITIAIILAMTYVSLFGLKFPNGIGIKGANEMRYGIDIRGGVDAAFQPKDLGRAPTAAEMDQARTVIETRLDQKNILDRDVTVDKQNGYVIVRFPWKSGETNFNPQQAIAELGETAKLTFRDPDGKIILDGSHVKKSVATVQKGSNNMEEPVVSLEFDAVGTKLFADATARLIGKPIAIYMDENKITAPTVQSSIPDGKAVIDHIGNSKEAKDLANKISAGMLPFSMVAKNYSTISATLGAGALSTMLQAGILAFILICLFLILYYRIPGIIACIALLLHIAGMLLALTIPQITCTLPGIAGLILAIGMGVDCNIITAERIKDELRSGKQLDSAIHVGYDKAFSPIFDGNITVLIVAFILMIYGSGSMLSFAYSLVTGVVMNFIAGVTASRIMLKSISQFKSFRKISFYTKERKEA
ncbi:MAG: protein translocase subunit SecD [Clostridiales bacterium]|nr:protein translocase subunit SecD [Clostridiales bacterium]